MSRLVKKIWVFWKFPSTVQGIVKNASSLLLHIPIPNLLL